MTRPCTRTVHSPQTWARVREAYAAGMTAGQIEPIYGVKPGALRQRAFREGWSRTAVRRAQEALSPPAGPIPPPAAVTPQEALNAALAIAGAHMAAGRSTEAAATLKAAETLHRLTTEIETARTQAAAEAAARNDAAETDFAAWIEHRAAALAQAVLKGEADAIRPAHADWPHRWWEEHCEEVQEPRSN